MKKLFFLGMIIVLSVSACSTTTTGPDIEVKEPWVRAAGVMKMEGEDKSKMDEEQMGGMGANTAAYMLLVNNSNQADKLIGVESQVAEVIELHESKMEGDVMKMQQVQFVEVPANGQVELKPGGKHIMLIGLKEELKVGDTVSLNLSFETAGEQTVEAQVKMP